MERVGMRKSVRVGTLFNVCSGDFHATNKELGPVGQYRSCPVETLITAS